MRFQTKNESIYETLKDEIYKNKYEFGERLEMNRLAKRFECSEIPVREALKKLSVEGLIEFKAYIGATVSTVSFKQITEIFQLRTVLESFATELATSNLTENDLKYLKDILDKSKEAFENLDFTEFEKLNIDFHMEIYKKSENELLLEKIKELWNNSARYPSVFEQNSEHIAQSIKEHDKIYEALLNRDANSARKYTIEHKERAGNEILKIKTKKETKKE